MEYFPWEHDLSDENLAWLDESLPDELGDDAWRWRTGISLASWFPENVTFKLSKDHGIHLADSIPNTLSCLVVSNKLKTLLSATGAEIEFFPVKIRNHKKKLVAQPYYLANLVGLLPCMDKSRSEFELSEIDGRVLHFRRLVLDESKIPVGTQIFRLNELRELHLVCRDLGVRIKRQEMCTGMQFTYLEDYGKEWRSP